jgi:hypothetical protein
MGLLIFFLIIIAIVFGVIVIRNNIVRHHNATIRAWSDVATYERQKIKILDGLEPLVEQYSSFEKGTLEKVTELRQNILNLNLNELNTQAHPTHNGGMCSHSLIGSFAYQNFELGDVMLTVAWRAEQSCRGYALPQIELVQHLLTDIKKPLD